MKKYKIHVTQAALRDLIGVSDYITNTLFNPQAAIDLENEAESSFKSLEFNPDRFAVIDDPFLSMHGCRLLIIKNYLAFYLVDDKTKIVYILRFLYSKQNWAEILGKGYSLE